MKNSSVRIATVACPQTSALNQLNRPNVVAMQTCKTRQCHLSTARGRRPSHNAWLCREPPQPQRACASAVRACARARAFLATQRPHESLYLSLKHIRVCQGLARTDKAVRRSGGAWSRLGRREAGPAAGEGNLRNCAGLRRWTRHAHAKNPRARQVERTGLPGTILLTVCAPLQTILSGVPRAFTWDTTTRGRLQHQASHARGVHTTRGHSYTSAGTTLRTGPAISGAA